MRWDWDYLLHFLGGGVIVGITVASSHWLIPFLMVIVLVVFGWGREKMQHDWRLPLTRHQKIEALAWPAGGLVAALLGLAF
jgi:hypothetical protein